MKRDLAELLRADGFTSIKEAIGIDAPTDLPTDATAERK